MKWKWVAWPLVIAFVALSAWTAYTNVYSDDSALRARAEKLAREKLGCADKCKLVRAEGTRGIFKETIAYTFTRTGVVTVTCKRPYIAFGEHVCTATK